jgi:hypothetical protein
MNQALYAHMNNKSKMKKKKNPSIECYPQTLTGILKIRKQRMLSNVSLNSFKFKFFYLKMI